MRCIVVGVVSYILSAEVIFYELAYFLHNSSFNLRRNRRLSNERAGRKYELYNSTWNAQQHTLGTWCNIALDGADVKSWRLAAFLC
jgi:hypothetical protein